MKKLRCERFETCRDTMDKRKNAVLSTDSTTIAAGPSQFCEFESLVRGFHNANHLLVTSSTSAQLSHGSFGMFGTKNLPTHAIGSKNPTKTAPARLELGAHRPAN